MIIPSQGLDPFTGFNDLFDKRADGRIKPTLVIGKVTSIAPIIVQADGMDLQEDDLRIAQHLTPREAWTVTTLPEIIFYGIDSMGGPCWVKRPEEKVKGRPTFDPDTESLQEDGSGVGGPGELLRVGDEVLLLPSTDRQTYYIIERMLKL